MKQLLFLILVVCLSSCSTKDTSETDMKNNDEETYDISNTVLPEINKNDIRAVEPPSRQVQLSNPNQTKPNRP